MPSSFHEGPFILILAKKISQQGTINGTGKGKRRKEKKETLEKKPTNYMQLINVLMFLMCCLKSYFSCLPSSTFFVIPEVQGKSIISVSFIAEN